MAFITGMKTQPKTVPMHQTGVLCPKARIKFSVHMEKSKELQMTLTRLLGGGITITNRLPTIVAIPVKVLTTPRANSLPPVRESNIAGKAA